MQQLSSFAEVGLININKVHLGMITHFKPMIVCLTNSLAPVNFKMNIKVVQSKLTHYLHNILTSGYSPVFV